MFRASTRVNQITPFNMKVSLFLIIWLLTESIDESSAQLTFYPKFRWDKNQIVYDQSGHRTAGTDALVAKKIQWDLINNILKDQINASPVKLIQTLLSFGIKPAVGSMEEVPVSPDEQEAKLIQPNQNTQKKAPKAPSHADGYVFDF